MSARTIHTLKLALLLILLTGLALVLSRPLAQTNDRASAGSVLRNARSIADLISNPNLVVGQEALEGDVLFRFYRLRDSRLAWSGNSTAAADAAIAMQALSEASEQGLDSGRYHLRQLAEADSAASTDAAATRDLLLTDAVLKYARDLRSGRRPAGGVDKDIDLPSEPFDAASALNAALDSGNLAQFLRDLSPPHPEYGRLVPALAHYRKLAQEGGWPQLTSPPRPGQPEADAYSDLLRERLSREDVTAGRDGDLTDALRRYQARNGLEPDGKLGPRTLAALNVAASERVEQIEANMERWRWLPRRLESSRIMVNAADATLDLVDEGRVVLHSKVIVGTPRNRTPMFRGLATAVTVNPPWNVPASIARNEILPRLRRDPNYLLSQDMVLLNGPPGDPHGIRIDWNRVSADAFPYRIQQKPGAGNALGQLKLEMSSAFGVYLHDTPGKSNFSRSERNLSHGCIRVEQILPLATLALRGDASAVAEKLAAARTTGETEHFALDQPLPVYVLYWTAMADPDGTVQFRRDVYGRDKRLANALRTASMAPPTFFAGDCVSTTG